MFGFTADWLYCLGSKGWQQLWTGKALFSSYERSAPASIRLSGVRRKQQQFRAPCACNRPEEARRYQRCGSTEAVADDEGSVGGTPESCREEKVGRSVDSFNETRAFAHEYLYEVFVRKMYESGAESADSADRENQESVTYRERYAASVCPLLRRLPITGT